MARDELEDLMFLEGLYGIVRYSCREEQFHAIQILLLNMMLAALFRSFCRPSSCACEMLHNKALQKSKLEVMSVCTMFSVINLGIFY